MLAILLVLRVGAADVLTAFARVGPGLLAYSAAHLIPLALDAASWRVFLPRDGVPRFSRLFVFRWISESVNTMLPVARLGGELVRARLVGAAGPQTVARGQLAGASVVADVFVGLAVEVLTTVAALLWLAARLPGAPELYPIAAAVGLFAAVVLGATWVERAGLLGVILTRAERWFPGSRVRTCALSVRVFEREVQGLFADRQRVLGSTMLRVLSTMATAAEAWLGLTLLGADVTLGAALVVSALGTLARSLAFAVPGAIGAQEAAFLLAGRLVGISGENALAFGLMRRTRELVFGVAGLTGWYVLSLASRPRSPPATPGARPR